VSFLSPARYQNHARKFPADGGKTFLPTAKSVHPLQRKENSAIDNPRPDEYTRPKYTFTV